MSDFYASYVTLFIVSPLLLLPHKDIYPSDTHSRPPRLNNTDPQNSRCLYALLTGGVTVSGGVVAEVQQGSSSLILVVRGRENSHRIYLLTNFYASDVNVMCSYLVMDV